MAYANARWNRKPLGILVGANGGIDELIGHCIGQILAVILRNQFQHEINRRGATGGGNTVAINDENRFRQFNFFELFNEAVLIFPMDRGAFTIKKPRFCQSITGRA